MEIKRILFYIASFIIILLQFVFGIGNIYYAMVNPFDNLFFAILQFFLGFICISFMVYYIYIVKEYAKG